MPKPDNYFSSLAGVHVHYARPPIAAYGTRGKSYDFFTEQDFEDKLNNAFQEIFDACGLGKAEVITSAGAYVNKPGYHGQGRAFDIDAIFWKEKGFVTLNYPSDQQFYLGVEAVLRKHFGTVLNYLYNRAHHDHLHIDDGSKVGFNTSSKSRVLFVQAALTHIFELPVAIDGVYGPQTDHAINDTLKALDISGKLTTKSIWIKFLDKVAATAFAQEKPEKEKSPSELLHHLLSLVDERLHDHEAKKTIEAAINAFAQHDKISNVLDEDNS